MNILILSAGTRNKIVQYFKKELNGKGFNFYDSIRDDKKEKSFSIYELGNTSETYFIGEQQFYTADYQIQIVNGLSKSEAERTARDIYMKYISIL